MKKLEFKEYHKLKSKPIPNKIYAFIYQGQYTAMLSMLKDSYVWILIDDAVLTFPPHLFYETIEEALEIPYNNTESEIYEFNNLKEFYEWGLQNSTLINDTIPKSDQET